MTLAAAMILLFSISNNAHLLLRFLSFWFGSNSFNFAQKISNSKKKKMKTTTSKRAHIRNLSSKLSSILCDEYILLTKTKSINNSLQSIDFQDKYLFFTAQSNEIDNIIERVEKRVHASGHYADAMLKAFLKVTRFNKKRKKTNDRAGYLSELLCDHENLITVLKKNTSLLETASRDYKTDDFVTTLTESHEKMAWFLRSYLK